MPDPLGDPAGEFSPFAFSRATVLESLGALRHVRRQARGAVGGNGPELPPLPPSVRVLVRNNTGADLPAYSVVAISGIIGSIADADNGSHRFAREPSFNATTPAATTDAFAILDEPCGYVAGGTGPLRRAVIQGVIPVDVNVTDAGHNYATPTASDNTKLTSATSGPARILYKPGGTGTLRCVVKLDESAVSGGGGFTPAYGISVLGGGSHFTAFTDATYVNVGISVLLPAAGTYLLFASATGSAVLSAGGPEYTAIRLINATDSTFAGEPAAVASSDAAGDTGVGCGSIQTIVTVAASKTISMQAIRTNNNTSTWAGTALFDGTLALTIAPGGTNMGYVRIA